MRLIVAQAIASTLYIFDASASPLLHFSLIYLTLIYLGSMLEIFGLSRFVRYLRARLSREHS